MATISHTLRIEGVVSVDVLADALQPRFTMAGGPERTTSTTWLDTFDWRLHGAGISLAYSDGLLTACLPDGAQLQTTVVAAKWPAQVDDLPVGRLRETLALIITPRALIPVVTVCRTARECRVLNADEKTVARLVAETAEDGTGLLHVRSLRGYDADADRIAKLLAGVDGLTVATTTPYDDALTNASRKPSDHDKALPLRPEMPAPMAIATVLLHFAAAIDVNVDGTIAAVDTEFLHDLRVAVRRTRSILKLTGDLLPGNLAARFEPEFKWLGDLTTPVRDLDVYLLGFADMAAGLTSAEPADLDPFETFLRRHRALERRRLVRGLRSRRFEKLMDAWRSALAEVADGNGDGPTVAALADERIRRAFRRVVKRGTHITAESPSEDVHALRKRCKELRYLLEVFGALDADAPYRPMIKELKALQNTLGEFQDGEVQREAVREFAALMMDEGAAPPATMLAMGELAAQLDAHQVRARAELEGRLRPLLAQETLLREKARARR